MVRSVLALFVALVAACQATQRMEVQVIGCLEMAEHAEGVECELAVEDEVELRVWVLGDAPWVTIDGAEVAPSRVFEVDGGHHLTIVVPGTARDLALERDVLDSSRRERWRLDIHWRSEIYLLFMQHFMAPLHASYNDARDEDCQAHAERMFDLAVAAERWRQAVIIAEIGGACSRRRGERTAVRRWRQAVGRVPDGMDDREVTRASLMAGSFLGEREYHAALDVLDAGIERASRFSMTTMHSQLLALRALALTEVGDFAGAIEAASEALDQKTHPYLTDGARAALRMILAWTLMRRSERTESDVPDLAEKQLGQALALIEDPAGECPLEYGAAVRLNLARYELLRGQVGAADRVLDEAASEVDSLGPLLQAELKLLHARVWLARGQYDAASAALAASDVEDVLQEDMKLELWVTRGELAEATGDPGAARSHYYRAHREALGGVHGLSPADGIQRFVFDRRTTTQHLVRLLNSLGESTVALRVAREAAGVDARLLVSRYGVVETRDQCREVQHDYLRERDESEWEILQHWSQDEKERLRSAAERATMDHVDALLADVEVPEALELRAPESGELLLMYLPLGKDRLIGFAAASGSIAVAEIVRTKLPESPLRPFGPDSPHGGLDEHELSEWSTRLLGPFENMIVDAERIRILPSFGVQTLPFHALPWRGRPLLAHAAVEYSLDLPGDGGGSSEAVRDALVVGDPRGDLDGARREAEVVGAHLRSRGVETTDLIGLSAAVGPAVRAALASVDHFHYAGHSAVASELGWLSRLELADGTALTIADILALVRVPRTVTLLSCSAGAMRTDPRAQGITLAGAFLLAGSAAVVASSIELRSDEASIVASELYGNAEMNADFKSTYRIAMLRLLEKDITPATWQSLRLWAP